MRNLIVLLILVFGSEFALAKTVLNFDNERATKFVKILKEGQSEILNFDSPVSLADYSSFAKFRDYIELEKLQPNPNGYRKFLLRAKKAGSAELNFITGSDLIKLEIIVEPNYDFLEKELNRLFGIENASEEEKIKVIVANQIENIQENPQTHVYLKGTVLDAKNALLAVAFAANVLGDQGVKIFSNPGGQLRQKNLDSPENSEQTHPKESFAEFYENTNKLIDTNNLYRDLILSSENEKVISFIKIKEPKRFAVKVRFLEMDLKQAQDFSSSLAASSKANDATGVLGSPSLGASGIDSIGGLISSITKQNFDSKGFIDLQSQVSAGNFLGATIKLFDKTFLNVNINDLLREGVLRIVNEFSLVTHSGEMVSLGKGLRFPIPKQNNGLGNTAITVEYIPIGFKGELKVIALENNLIDVQLASRLSSAKTTATTLNGIGIPIFSEEYVNSGALLQSGQEVILNAFMTETETIAKTQSPLGRILPIFGASRNKQKNKNVLFIALEVEQLHDNIGQNKFNLPHLDLANSKNLYAKTSADLRASNITESIDLSKLNQPKIEIETDPLKMEVDF